MNDKEKLKKAFEAMKIAESVLNYVCLDKWETEVTEEDRGKFFKLCDELNIYGEDT